MNELPLEKRAQILTLLCEGSSMRLIERICGLLDQHRGQTASECPAKSRSPFTMNTFTA